MRRASGSIRASSRPVRTAAAVALALVLAGCPGGDDGDRPEVPGRRPDRGGELIVAYPWEPATLNPFVAGGDAPPTRDLVRPLWPALYRLGPQGARSLWLLAREPAGADIGGTPWSVRLRLREDAVWSNGTPITANDLRFTWQAVMTSPGIASRDGYDRLADVLAESPKVARLVFRAPFARWRDLFGAGLGVLPQHALGRTDISKALARSWPISGGPFMLKAWTPGLEMVFERNPRAWGTAPNLDRIRVQFVPDPVTALQLYAAGKVDVLGPYVAADLARRARVARSGTTTSDRGATWAGLFLNVRTPALSDARVRRALAMGMNRRAIAEGLVREQGLFTDSPSAADASRTSASFARYRYEPADAEKLLDDAGWRGTGSGTRRKAGRELSVTVASVGHDELVQRVLRACNGQAAAIGIDLNLIAMDANELWGTWIHGSRFQAALLVERDPPGGALRARFGLPGAHDVSRLNDAGLRADLDAADAALDPNATVVDAPFTRLAELVPVVPLFVLDVVLAARKGVNEVAASAAADGFLAGSDRWWIEGATPLPTVS